MRTWIDEPTTEDHTDVDVYECHRCGNPVGAWTGGDDDRGRVTSDFHAYTLSADGRRRWCEDCTERLR